MIDPANKKPKIYEEFPYLMRDCYYEELGNRYIEIFKTEEKKVIKESLKFLLFAHKDQCCPFSKLPKEVLPNIAIYCTSNNTLSYEEKEHEKVKYINLIEKVEMSEISESITSKL